MIDKKHQLSITGQCQVLGLGRSSFYYRPRGESTENLDIMRLIDECFMSYPTWGVRRMTYWLRNQGYSVNFKRIQRLMRLIGLEPIYPKKNLSVPGDGHKIYPYLVKKHEIERPNQLWCSDITYIPMRRGFMYLVAIMDWHSRKILSWRLSNSLDAGFCIEALQEALCKHAPPEMFNTDQGCQFTCQDWIKVLEGNKITISMDGKGRWIDNVFIERLWRSLKQECVYIHDFENGHIARDKIGQWVTSYNDVRPHLSLDGQTPDMIYFSPSGYTPMAKKAA